MSRATFTLAPKQFEIEVHGVLNRGLPATRLDPAEPPSADLTRVFIGAHRVPLDQWPLLNTLCPNWQAEAERELLEQAPTAEDVSDDKYDELKSEGKI